MTFSPATTGTDAARPISQRTAFPLVKCLACGWLFLPVVLWGAETAKPPVEDLPAPDEPLAISPWQPFYNLRIGTGYKDNVTLSSFNRSGSSLTYTELEVTLIRLPVDGTQFNAFVIGEDTRYWRPGLVDKEQTFISLVQLKRDLNEVWQLGITGQHFYQNQVFDVSSTEQNTVTLLAEANTFALRPSLRRQFNTGWWTELELEASRANFIAPLDDYWELGPKLTLGKEYGRKSELTFGWQYRQRAYDNREQVSLARITQAGQSLRVEEHEVEAASRHYWDEQKRWRSTLRLAGSMNQDNGEGFFNYWRGQATAQMDYRSQVWTVQAKARVSHHAYWHQTVSAIDPQRRAQTSLLTSLRVERRLGRQWKVFLEGEHELLTSNRPLDGYRANTFLAGLEWEH